MVRPAAPLPITVATARRIRPLRRSEYDRLVELGAFRDEKVELIHGVLVPMSPQGNAHAFVIELLTDILQGALHGLARVRVQCPLALGEFEEPEPDLAVVPRVDWRDDHPSTASLVVEVAVTSLADDRDVKGPLYAAAGIPEYWLVDVEAEAVVVHRGPLADQWTEVIRHDRNATIAPVAFPALAVPVAALFPRR